MQETKCLPKVRQYHKVTVFKQCGIDTKTGHLDQWNRIESSEIKPYTHSQSIFNKGGKDTK